MSSAARNLEQLLDPLYLQQQTRAPSQTRQSRLGEQAASKRKQRKPPTSWVPPPASIVHLQRSQEQRIPFVGVAWDSCRSSGDQLESTCGTYQSEAHAIRSKGECGTHQSATFRCHFDVQEAPNAKFHSSILGNCEVPKTIQALAKL